jgi:hypothetical protein
MFGEIRDDEAVVVAAKPSPFAEVLHKGAINRLSQPLLPTR